MAENLLEQEQLDSALQVDQSSTPNTVQELGLNDPIPGMSPIAQSQSEQYAKIKQELDQKPRPSQSSLTYEQAMNNTIIGANRLNKFTKYDWLDPKVESYNKKAKTYQFEIIIGLQTNSDDPLGIIENIKIGGKYISIEKVKYIQKFIEQYLDKLFNIDSFYQSFHNYSSKKVNGEPLWLHTKNKDNLECPNPVHLVSIYDYEIKDIKTYNYQIWKDEIVKSIDSIDKKSDFNQENIIKQWNDLEQEFDQETIKQNIYSIPIVLTVSSGFYVRQFVRDLSNLLKFPLMANDINRTEIFL